MPSLIMGGKSLRADLVSAWIRAHNGHGSMQAEDFFTIFSISLFVSVFSITFSSFFFTFTIFGVDWASGRCFAHVGHRSRQAEDLFFHFHFFAFLFSRFSCHFHFVLLSLFGWEKGASGWSRVHHDGHRSRQADDLFFTFTCLCFLFSCSL